MLELCGCCGNDPTEPEIVDLLKPYLRHLFSQLFQNREVKKADLAEKIHLMKSSEKMTK